MQRGTFVLPNWIYGRGTASAQAMARRNEAARGRARRFGFRASGGSMKHYQFATAIVLAGLGVAANASAGNFTMQVAAIDVNGQLASGVKHELACNYVKT